jgi:hypothetical protein
MGWKAVKEYYRIDHHVQVTDEGICIGSPYIHNIIVIDMDGNVSKRPSRTSNESLLRYLSEFETDPEKLCELVRCEDQHDKSITVYTYCSGEIIEKQCEEPGWPNCTCDGEMMYDNTFSTDKAVVVEWAKRSAKANIDLSRGVVERLRSELKDHEKLLEECISYLEKLNTDYPGV